MNRTTKHNTTSRTACKYFMAVLLMLISVTANAVIVTKGFSGIWDQPDHESQGFNIEIIDHNGVRKATVYWYTYDTEGNPMWLAGLGDVVDDQINIELFTVTDVTNLQPANPVPKDTEVLATANLSFSDCQNGIIDIKPSSISGTGGAPNSISGTGGIVRIQRLTQIMNTSCSGGISDDQDPMEPLDDDAQFIGNTGVYPQANAKFAFKERSGSTHFEVQIEDVPTGNYDLFVAGINRGQINVITTASGTEGKLEFESPASENDLLLDFDPRGQLLEIFENSTLLFSSNFEPAPNPDTDPVGNGAPPFGDSKVRVDMTNTGLFSQASGRTELEQRADRVEFSVEIEDLPLGTYDLYVGGVLKGNIDVVMGDGGMEGEIKFEFPVENNELLLDFDPRGQLIEVRSGGQSALEVSF